MPDKLRDSDAAPPGAPRAFDRGGGLRQPASEPEWDVAALAGRLRDLVGGDRVVAEPEVSIHGRTAHLGVRPADERHLAAALALADAERLGVCVVGGGTKLGWGDPPDRFDLLVHTGDLRSTCVIDADDLTARVAAGVTVAEAQARARAAGRVLPLDAGLPGSATVGGVVATGDQGARGAGYGAVRDLVLGLRATLADGTSVKFGGLTMKNVAGYDMSKLFVGSFGVLGVITEVNLRLLPRAEAQALLVLPLESLAQGGEIAARILDSYLQPLVLEALSPQVVSAIAQAVTTAGSALGLGSGGGPILLAGFAGHQAAVDRSVAEVRSISEVQAGLGAGDVAVLRDDQAEAVLEALTACTAATGSGPGP
ncbi:MAG: FAD-binding oxidoreductase, partial [Actinomycetia bacterium]|nr:FAD-binding oxidoreductase [Actinomycetes bacterium]